MERKIISTFMFSEPHEQELLWLKFNVENSFVSEWFIIESIYTFQGKIKQTYLSEILKQDRFKQFLNKVTVINISKNYNFEFEPSIVDISKRRVKRFLTAYCKKKYDLVSYAELASFYSEIQQRQSAVKQICRKYSQDDILITCDVDEIFDLNGQKYDEFKKILSENITPFYIKRIIYCYDYNNVTYRDRYSPIIRVSDIRGDDYLHRVRHPHPAKRNIVYTINNLAYEYTFCFSFEAMMKKLRSFAHVTDLDEHALIFCLANNISLINPNQIDSTFLQEKNNLYDTIELNCDASPQFLLENIDFFKTNVVDKSYLINRRNSLL